MNIIKKLRNRINREVVERRDEIQYYLDLASCEEGEITLRGWIFSRKDRITDLKLVIRAGREEKVLPMEMFRRVDVANAFGLSYNRCGFRLTAEYESELPAKAYIQYYIGSRTGKITLFGMEPHGASKELMVAEKKKLTFGAFEKECVLENPRIAPGVYDTVVDVIVPVYNGFEYLEGLFDSIEKTKVPYRLFIINDKSTDERVLPFLREYVKGRENVHLEENQENLGFVQSVNKGLAAAKGHVAIVNTDVVLPEGWLERLMTPILEDENIASTTPFTNSGTICSFPVFCDNNSIFLDMSVDQVDGYFAKIKPRYVTMPTGVGFCMGMSHKAIEEVGVLDAETFYKGYGEENDWCQRAIKKGYRNIQVENLYVWHKHGGSFLSEDKQRYIDRNLKLLGERYPAYHKDVADYCAKDPNEDIREYVKAKIMLSEAKKAVVIFSHNWGGGANSYMDDRIEKMTAEQMLAVEVIDDAELGLFAKLAYQGQEASFFVKDYPELYDALKGLDCQEIIINELVSFEHIAQAQAFALQLKETYHCKLTMLCHDFYAVCPSIYLINHEKQHCFLPDQEACQACYEKNSDRMNREYDSIAKWREIWKDFLQQCDDVIAFSENTKGYYQKVYDLPNYQVVPHQVDYIRPVKQHERKKGDPVTIGVIGNLMPSKGAQIIRDMADLIKEEHLPAKIVVIGPDRDGGHNTDVLIHGQYQREELPDLMEKYGIDVIFIASIWPETFSYTTEEAMKMGMKVAAFDLGAPAERLKKYDKGILIEEISAKAALKQILKQVR